MINDDYRVPDCPTFRPSWQEWAGDPFAYIRSVIAVGAQGHSGIAKIVPPPGWVVPFSLPNRETFTFTPRVQILNALEATVRAQAQFVIDLRLFNFVKGHPLSPPMPVRARPVVSAPVLSPGQNSAILGVLASVVGAGFLWAAGFFLPCHAVFH